MTTIYRQFYGTFTAHPFYPGRASNKKWEEKAGLLTRLETQVKRMKENFDSKEKNLLEEREKALQAHK